MLNIWFKSVSWCESYIIVSESENFFPTLQCEVMPRSLVYFVTCTNRQSSNGPVYRQIHVNVVESKKVDFLGD